MDLSDAVWRKSSRSSGTSNNCVEVADNLRTVVAVRDSKAPARGAHVVRAGAWRAFVTAVKYDRV